jgi:hypothetical protein
MRIIALTAVVALACGAAACETTSAMSESAAERAAEAAPPASPPSMAPGPQMAYSDEQLRNFIRANSEVSAIASRHTSVLQSGSPEQKAAARAQIQSEALPVLARHNLDAQTYNAIANAARTDPSVQARLAQLRGSTPGG